MKHACISFLPDTARNFLVNISVVPKKIKVFSQADGRFIGPNIAKGRALNRRVEIEFFR